MGVNIYFLLKERKEASCSINFYNSSGWLTDDSWMNQRNFMWLIPSFLSFFLSFLFCKVWKNHWWPSGLDKNQVVLWHNYETAFQLYCFITIVMWLECLFFFIYFFLLKHYIFPFGSGFIVLLFFFFIL